MSLLRERLNRLKKTQATKPVAPSPDKPSEAAEISQRMAPPEGSDPKPASAEAPPEEAAPAAGWERLGARFESNEWGGFLIRKHSYPAGHRHGRYPLGKLSEVCSELAELAGKADLQPEELLFFDTETTGLGIGAGNVPFMLGIGYYRSGQFIVEQMLIRNPAEEIAMLAYFNRLLAGFSCLVTYNGRTFDWPIIKNRYILNRMELDQEPLTQLDFLYASRSLWRNTLPACRLGIVEESRLGHIRVDDVPGSLAPTLYFRYLAEGDPSILEGVLDHNEQDVLSLAGLAIHFGKALRGELELTGMEAEELYRLGKWLHQWGRPEQADRAFERLLLSESRDADEFRLELAALYKKKGKYDLALPIWKGLVSRPPCASQLTAIEPYIELAKYYEHKEKNYGDALAYAEEAYHIAWRRESLLRRGAKHQPLLEEIRKRVDRLKTKEMRKALEELHDMRTEYSQLELRVEDA
ncbi:ribonuclease H-like domain-containing protein [Paenibacillus sp. J2TS4]|uniref:ribonuclease H-like domain-containing protein n=1 Tax=Paenibacillus sp. J2TS4 TaxID=2807194 RepID=UPI001B153C9A|nr:ribonuclease H-like domain-containing protein [Paenibacillus sp. J2TS4]GIP32652.1 hypothetical protein J2TS4_18620 [Paenibacillus sp. J2TS4]